MRTKTIQLGLILSGLLAAQGALAGQYTFGIGSGNVGVTVYDGTTAEGTSAGGYMMSPGSSYNPATAFDVFCIDLKQNISQGQTVDYTGLPLASAPVGGDGPMGTAKATQINALIDLYYGHTSTYNLQIAIWDVLVSGDILNSGNPAVPTGDIANMLAAAALDHTPSSHTALTDAVGAQNFVDPVPDGGTTLVLLGMGMGSLAFVARRVRR